jgi:outer membrane protein OmpA-like peptidoglycan-associated protein
MRYMTRIAVLLPALLVVASGCATKDWVQQLMDTKEGEINQRMDTKEGEINQRTDGLSEQVRETGEAVKGARDRADSAMNEAEGAKADGLRGESRLTRLWSNRYKGKPVKTVDVYFVFDKADLSGDAQTALLGVVKELEASPSLVVRLDGFTDLTGTRDYNYGLAQRRVEVVRRFLADKGVELSRLLAISIGPLDDRGTSTDKKRRVTVILMADSD